MTRAQLALGVVISIHALVKRATKIFKISSGATFISIHALVKRATPKSQARRFAFVFQSTPS